MINHKTASHRFGTERRIKLTINKFYVRFNSKEAFNFNIYYSIYVQQNFIPMIRGVTYNLVRECCRNVVRPISVSAASRVASEITLTLCISCLVSSASTLFALSAAYLFSLPKQNNITNGKNSKRRRGKHFMYFPRHADCTARTAHLLPNYYLSPIFIVATAIRIVFR